MSNALALAGVSAVLKDLLDNGLIDHAVVDALGTGVKVSVLAPDLVPVKGTGLGPRLNLFLHQVTPNAAYRNSDLASRGHGGEALRHPPLALDLHYLLSAYGVADFEAELLLGYALQLLHETPALTRERIRTALNPDPLSIALLPPLYQALQAVDLAEQFELLRISPSPLNGEELSRLWSALQAPYRTSAGFTVSVVLIDSAKRGRSPLPVLRRGAADQGVVVVPSLQMPLPTLERVEAPAHRNPGLLRAGEPAELHGHHLGGSQRRLVLRNDRLGQTVSIPLADDPNDLSPIAFTPAVGLAPGLWRLHWEGLSPADPPGSAPRSSAGLSLAIAPALNLPPLLLARQAGNTVRIRLAMTPPLRAGQRVALMLGTQELPAVDFADGAAQAEFVWPAAPPAGSVWRLRLRVDGIESVLIDRRQAGAPAFFPLEVTLP